MRKYTMIGVLTLAASLVACSGQDKTASVPETSYSENTEAVDRIPESNTDTPEKSTEAPNQIPESNTDTPEESIESTETGSETSEMNTAPSSNAGEQEPKAIDAKPLFEAAAANGEEKIIIPEYAYYEADRIVLYIEKGAVVPQDMIL
ncbi:MAG: hypothetical protein J6T47_10595, partial [Lachnospiraceae bacterium]|nr:hypothetical protein [Lachnospiraceae bacterium]